MKKKPTIWMWPHTAEVSLARAARQCPFCGSSDVFSNTSTPGSETGAKVECHDCGANGPWATGPRVRATRDAVKMWNGPRFYGGILR